MNIETRDSVTASCCLELDLPPVSEYAGITEFKRGYRTRQTCGFFMPGIRPEHAEQWRDDRPEYNTCKGNTVRASFEAQLSPAALTMVAHTKFKRRSS